MNYLILFILLLLLLLLYLKFVKCDMFQPYILTICSYMLALFFCYVKWNEYNLSLKSLTIVFIIFIFMFFSSLFAYYLSKGNRTLLKFNFDFEINKPIHFNKKNYIIILALILIMIISIFFDRYLGARNKGYNDSIFAVGKLARFVYNISLFSNYKMLHINTYFNYFLYGFLSISIYYILNNIYKFNESIIRNVDNLVIVFLIIFNIFMSGQRGNMFFVVSVFIGSYAFIFNEIKYKKNNYFKIIFNILKVALSFSAFWIVTHILMFKSLNLINSFSDFLTYLSGGIITFDEYVNGIVVINKPILFGDRVFANIYNYLNRLNFGDFNPIGTWIPINDQIIGINIYSGFFFSYEGFGLFGASIYWSIILFLFTYMYSILKRNGSSNYLRIVYSYFTMPLYLISFSDNFAVRFISTTPIYIFVYFWIAYYIYNRLIKN